MVGHTGVIAAAVTAVETVDECLGRVVEAVHAKGGACIVTADHGNADEMLEEDGSPDTAHSLNPVPFIVTAGAESLDGEGILADVAPTALALLGIDQPEQMTGRSLLGVAQRLARASLSVFLSFGPPGSRSSSLTRLRAARPDRLAPPWRQPERLRGRAAAADGRASRGRAACPCAQDRQPRAAGRRASSPNATLTLKKPLRSALSRLPTRRLAFATGGGGGGGGGGCGGHERGVAALVAAAVAQRDDAVVVAARGLQAGRHGGRRHRAVATAERPAARSSRRPSWCRTRRSPARRRRAA